MAKGNYYRNCPECGDEILYSTKYVKIRAEKRNTNCNSCATKGKNNSMYGKTGENNPNYGIKRSDETRKRMSEVRKGKTYEELYGKEKAKETKKKMKKNNSHYWCGTKRPEHSKKMIGKNNPMYRKKCTEETRKKMRLSRFKYVNSLYGVKFPNYNSDACKIIDEYSKKYNYNFRHAENGGEVCIDGYFPDGLDEKRKTIIEIDEKHHFNSGGKLKQKDIQRQEYLEDLGYKFIRVRI